MMTRRKQPLNEINEILILVARRWKTVALVVVISFGISGIFGYQKLRIYHATISLEVGTLGVISWTNDNSIDDCISDHLTAEFLMCQFKHSKNNFRPMSVPIENVQVTWRRLYHQYDLKNSRKGIVELPHLYQVTFDSNHRSLFIETRGSTVEEAFILVRHISNSIIRHHKDIVDKHVSHTTAILDKITKRHLSSKTNIPGTQSFSPNYQSEEILAILSIANSLSKPTKVQTEARSIPRNTTGLLVVTISGLLIGLIAGLLLALLIETIESCKAFNISAKVTKK